MAKEKWGVILGRFMPVHNGHVEVIYKALKENDKVLVLVSSEDKHNERNPIPAEVRKKLIYKVILSHRLKVDSMADYTDENDNSNDWGVYLYHNIISRINGNKEFTLYYGDSIETLKTWFGDYLQFINVVTLNRSEIANGISATKVRDMIVLDDRKGLSDAIPLQLCNDLDLTALKYYIKMKGNESL